MLIQVPAAAAVYHEDVYVNFKLSMDTASQIAGIRLWITNEYMHFGLRVRGDRVLDHLLGMLNGKKLCFDMLFLLKPTRGDELKLSLIRSDVHNHSMIY